ncbi:hypothetical protein MMC25_003862 [Agyrium rufum]|nr:hypothetical protein [Agyrium rufum]
MTSFLPAPGSPPELTSSSRSSKASSLHSSSLSGADGGILSSDLAHFEDIGLQDDQPASSAHEEEKLYRTPSFDSKKSGSKVTVTSVSGFRKTMSGASLNGGGAGGGEKGAGAGGGPSGNVRPGPGPMPGMRELTIGMRRPMQSASFQGQSHPQQTYPRPSPRPSSGYGPPLSLSTSNGRSQRRSIGGPSSPSAMTAMRNRSQSRSPSPGGRTSLISPRSAASSTTPHLLPSASLGPRRTSMGRRASWVPSRKSTKELEAEYHDSDEDLPDDASLWNVPLSPSMLRTASSAVSSAAPSANGSPERPSHLGVPLKKSRTNSIPTSAPAASQRFSIGEDRGPNVPGKPPINRVMSTSVIPEDGQLLKPRVKSWNIALNELSEEAASLSEALEAYALKSAEQTNPSKPRASTSTNASRPSLDRPKKSSARSSAIVLPPLRKSEVMIDPLPISKEKEKVLSRTRPSWLPPKNPKEEAKHLKEYQRMMELSLEADRRKAARVAKSQTTQDQTAVILQRIWAQHVLPNWATATMEPRTRELWWRGIPTSARGEAWSRAIGNELSLTASTYTRALMRAAEALKDISIGKPRHEETLWFNAIARDIGTTMPDLNLFQEGQPLHDALTDLLMAYSLYRSDVGYAHGTHIPAALLLMVLSDAVPPSAVQPPQQNQQGQPPVPATSPSPYSNWTWNASHASNSSSDASKQIRIIPNEAQSFIALANLMNRPLTLAFLTGEQNGTERTYALTLNLLQHKIPKLYEHLFSDEGLGLAPEDVLEPMIRTLFGQGCARSVRVRKERVGGVGSRCVSPLPNEGGASHERMESQVSTTSSLGLGHSQGNSPSLSQQGQQGQQQLPRTLSPVPFYPIRTSSLTLSPNPSAADLNHNQHSHHQHRPSSSGSNNANNGRSTPSDYISVTNGLPLPHLLRIFDVLVFDGDAMAIRTCVGILASLEHRLYGGRKEVLSLLGWQGSGRGVGGVLGVSTRDMSLVGGIGVGGGEGWAAGHEGWGMEEGSSGSGEGSGEGSPVDGPDGPGGLGGLPAGLGIGGFGSAGGNGIRNTNEGGAIRQGGRKSQQRPSLAAQRRTSSWSGYIAKGRGWGDMGDVDVFMRIVRGVGKEERPGKRDDNEGREDHGVGTGTGTGTGNSAVAGAGAEGGTDANAAVATGVTATTATATMVDEERGRERGRGR